MENHFLLFFAVCSVLSVSQSKQNVRIVRNNVISGRQIFHSLGISADRVAVIVALGTRNRRKEQILSDLTSVTVRKDATEMPDLFSKGKLRFVGKSINGGGAVEKKDVGLVVVGDIDTRPTDRVKVDLTGLAISLTTPVTAVFLLPIFASEAEEALESSTLPGSMLTAIHAITSAEMEQSNDNHIAGSSLKLLFVVEDVPESTRQSLELLFQRQVDTMVMAKTTHPRLLRGKHHFKVAVAILSSNPKDNKKSYEQQLRKICTEQISSPQSNRLLHVTHSFNSNALSPTAARDALPSKDQLIAFRNIDKAAQSAMAEANRFLSMWRSLALRNQVINRFGDRGDELIRKVVNDFKAATEPYGDPHSMTSKKLTELRYATENGLRDIFLIQLRTLENESRRYMRDLLAKSIQPIQGIPEDVMARAVNQTERTFLGKANELVVSPSLERELRLVLDSRARFLRMRLSESAKDLASSPLVRLAVQQETLEAQLIGGIASNKRKKGFRVGLALAGMIRQDGYGNLQGFTNYDLGPFHLALGYANDRNTPEVMQDGQKPPFLRIQPKVHFDVDL